MSSFKQFLEDSNVTESQVFEVRISEKDEMRTEEIAKKKFKNMYTQEEDGVYFFTKKNVYLKFINELTSNKIDFEEM